MPRELCGNRKAPGGVRAPLPACDGKIGRRAACPQAAVQCGGYGTVPRANNVRPYRHCPIVFPLKKNFKFQSANFL